jgi:FlaA1/EpsC-like NDP-sugar epimerase
MLVGDVLFMSLALASAILVTGDHSAGLANVPWALVPQVAALSLPIFWLLGLYKDVVRFLRSRAIFSVSIGVTACVLPILVHDFMSEDSVDLGTALVFWAFGILYVGGSRFVMRDFLRRQARSLENVIVYGAGAAGVRLATVLMSGEECVPVAFIDDARTLQGQVVAGLPVRDPSKLPELLKEFHVERLLLAIPSTTRRRRRSILRQLERYPVHVQTVPDIHDLLSGQARLEELREVEVEDLLGRDPVPARQELFKACIENRSVLVSGAGGSIGSELCRQVLQQRPTRLVLLERSEPALYGIERELRSISESDGLDVEIVPILGSVLDRVFMERLLKSFHVRTMYHAAAYKHVPLVEYNMAAGVQNNIFGTLSAALSAEKAGVDNFVLVSTDKAVNPTNVMGATKRFAEMVLQGIVARGTRMRICMVRFGNVLASSGSVVPLFREQIHAGGPLTVTHRDIVRYFMTIPEAAQLVIQAGAMAQGGEVFLLDMGKPVKIDDLARKMIHLMGLEVADENNPDGDIEIKYTGLRPAEKLYEELLISGNATGTEHERIWRANEHSVSWTEIESAVRAMEVAVGEHDCERMREILEQVVAEYAPPGGLVDRVWRASHPVASRSGSVVELPTRRRQGGPDGDEIA